jgi:hypothetical protein
LKNTYLDYKVFVLPDFHQTDAVVAGENNKQVLIACIHENNAELDVFLERIISSAKLNLNTDCLMIKMSDNESIIAFSKISTQYPIKKALFFGITPKSVGLNVDCPTYFPFVLNDCTFLFVDPLSKIINNNDLKKGLWNCMQRVLL